MTQKKIEDYLAGVDVPANYSYDPWFEILFAAWPGMPAADNFYQYHLCFIPACCSVFFVTIAWQAAQSSKHVMAKTVLLILVLTAWLIALY